MLVCIPWQVLWDMLAMLKTPGEQPAGMAVTVNATPKLELTVSARMRTLSVLCHDEGAAFLGFVMSDTRLDVEATLSTSHIRGSLGMP